MAHTRSWDEVNPEGTDAANQLDTQIQQDKVDVRERMVIEHNWNNSTDTTAIDGDGRHKAGYVGAAYQGSTAQIDALDDAPNPLPGDGALAHDTTLNVLKRYNISATAWKPISNLGNVFYATLSAITPSAQGVNTAVVFDTEVKDTANQYDDTTGKITVKVPGVYYITGSLDLNNPTVNVKYEAAIYKNGLVDPDDIILRGASIVPNLAGLDYRVVVSGYAELAVGDEVVLGYNTSTGSNTVQIEGTGTGWSAFGAHLVFADYTV